MSVTDTTTPTPTAAPPADPIRAALEDPATYTLLLRHAAAAYRGNKSNVEDIVQIACLRAHAKSGSYDPAKSSITTWVGGFIRIVCYEQYRKEGRQPRHRPDFDLTEVPARPTPEDACSEWRLMFEACLESLSREDRDILDLAHIKGWEHARIAKHYGITNAAARQRASRALFRVTQFANTLRPEGQS